MMKESVQHRSDRCSITKQLAPILHGSIGSEQRRFTMWWMPADGSAAEERLFTQAGNESQFANSWSPDGKALAFAQKGGLYILPLEGDHTPYPLVQSRFVTGSLKFSPDGNWVAYSSNQSGKPQIYVQPASGPGPKIQVSTNSGTDPIWSRKSDELFYRDGDMMMACAVSTKPKLIVSKPEVLWTGHYSHGVSSSCMGPGPTSVNYDVTADGQRFIMIQDKDQDVVGRQLVIVLNWAEELRRLAQKNK